MLGIEADDETLRPHGPALRGGTAGDAAAQAAASCCRHVREILEHLRGADDVRSYLLTGNTRGGATGEADALRPVRSTFPTARSPRTRASAPRSRRARSSWPAAPARSPGSRVRHRRHAARHRVRQRHRREDDCRGDRRLHRRRARDARPVARHGTLALTGRVPTADRDWGSGIGDPGSGIRDRKSSGQDTGSDPDPDPGSRDHRMRRVIRRIPALWRASRLARRWYHARVRRLPGLAHGDRRGHRRCGSPRATPRAVARAC